jgi:20S proteasome subunit alpha 5
MTLIEAQNLTLKILKQVMEEKLDHHNVQIARVSNLALYSVLELAIYGVDFQVTPDKGFEIIPDAQLQEIIQAMGTEGS